MSVPEQQKALIIPSAGAPLSVESIEVPQPGAGEVLVRAEAVGLNPVDWKAHEFGITLTNYPAILGCEVAGVVVKVGSQVTNRAIGDTVAFQSHPTYHGRGGFQQFVVVQASLTFEVPPNITKDQAATVPAGAVTAAHALYTDYIPHLGSGGANLVPFWKDGGLRKYVGTPFVVFGGATANGQFIIQTARMSGLGPIITTASPRNEELLKSLGATHILDRNLGRTELLTKIREVTEKPIQLVCDSVAIAETQNLAYDVVASGGQLLLSLPSVIDPKKIVPDKQVIFFNGKVSIPEYSALDDEFLSVLPTYLKTGEIKPLVPELLPDGLHGIPEGLNRLKRNEVTARKLVAHPSETV